MTNFPTIYVIFVTHILTAMKHFHSTIIMSAALLVASCGGRATQAGDTAATVAIGRIDLAVAGVTQPDTAALDSLRPGLDLYLLMMGLDTVDIPAEVKLLGESPIGTTFGREVVDNFTLTRELAGDIGATADRLGRELPDAAIARLYAVISPYNQSVIVSDSIVMVATNHYLGPGHEAYGQMPGHIRVLKDPARIPADIAEAAIRVAYPYRPSSEPTLLERMLYEGAVATAVEAVAPQGGAARALKMSEADYKDAAGRESAIWQQLVAGDGLYTTSPDAIARALSSTQPRRDAALIGYRIVGQYRRQRPSASLEQLLSPDFYHSAQTRLIESRYRPE